jgi:hypothetical protein
VHKNNHSGEASLHKNNHVREGKPAQKLPFYLLRAQRMLATPCKAASVTQFTNPI